jgi:hypothetical protein
MSAMTWTTPADLAAQVQRHWDQGRILAAGLTGEALFPLALRLSQPSPRELGQQFESVRNWIRALEAGAKPTRGCGYEIAWKDTNNRQLGRNRIPAGVTVPTRADALALIGKAEAAESFDTLVRATCDAIPELGGWLASKPLTALEHAADWQRILDALTWFRANPRCGLYLRQIDIAGIDTKFIEARKGLLAELLDIVLPPDAVDAHSVGFKGFEARYGLRTKPNLIRFRILDARLALSSLTDLTVPATQFARLSPAASRIFITENEINGLAFPEVANSIVVFGLGYGIRALAEAQWLQDREIHYWGDIDTHGFAMLDQLRTSFPRAQSLLMDRATLEAHWHLRSEEISPQVGRLEHLTEAEQSLYDDLRFDRRDRRVRLEQERIAFGWLQRALAER